MKPLICHNDTRRLQLVPPILSSELDEAPLFPKSPYYWDACLFSSVSYAALM